MADMQRQGPATFSIEGGDTPVGSAATPQLGVPSAQPEALSPGLQFQQGEVNDVNAKTFRAITELASGVLAPKIKEAAQEQFISGVQRAMTGEALGEIIKDQPWYTDIFAPSAALAGARTYTAQAAVAQWAGKMQEQMPQLAKVGPEQLQAAATGALQGFMTGDPEADAMITAHVVEHMAPLFKQQAKEHYVYVQKVASEAQLNAWEAAGKVYQGLAATEASGKGTVSPEDKEAAKSRLLGSIVPFADQSDQAYERNIAAFLEGTAAQGNFHVIRLFKDTGLYDKIPPDKRATLDRSLHTFARQALDQQIPKFAMDIAQLVNDPTQDPREIPARVQALNDKAAKLTGITEASLIPPQTVDNLVGNVMRAQRAAADQVNARGQARQDKLDEKAANFNLALSQIKLGPGAVDQGLTFGLFDEKAAEAAGYAAWRAAQNPAEAAKVLNSRTLGEFKAVKSDLNNLVNTPEYNGGVGKVAQVYDQLDDAVKPHYFDETTRSLMDRFNAMVRSDVPPQAAWVMAKNAPITQDLLPADAKGELQKAIRDEVSSATSSHLPGIGVGPWFGHEVDDAGIRTIESAVARVYKQDRGNNPPDVAAKRGIAYARRNGLDFMESTGKHVVQNMNRNDPPLFRVVGESMRGTAEAFESVMADKAKAHGISLDNYSAVRIPDVNGHAFIYVEATDMAGKSAYWSINSDELKETVTKNVARQRMLSNASPQQRYEPDQGGAPLIPGLQN